MLLPATAALAGNVKVRPGHYKVTGADGAKFVITVQLAQCRNPQNEGPLVARVCVALPSTPSITEACAGGTKVQGYFGNFLTPVQLPASGKITEHTTSYEGARIVGDSTFSVTFQRNGTAAGYIEQSGVQMSAAGQNVKCTSGKVRFTAKL